MRTLYFDQFRRIFTYDDFQPRPDVVVSVTEPVIRVRVRQTALSTVISVAANNEELSQRVTLSGSRGRADTCPSTDPSHRSSRRG